MVTLQFVKAFSKRIPSSKDMRQQPFALKKPQWFIYLLAGSVIFGNVNPLQAAQIADFKASYEVNAFGMSLGKAQHTFSCQQSDCTLVSNAKPSGWISTFVKETAEETVKLTQTEQSLNWLSYQKIAIVDKNGKEVKKTTTYGIDKANNRIFYTEKKRSWPIQTPIYDLLSLAYGIQFLKLNNKPLESLYIQDNNFQDKLTFTAIDQPQTMAFDFANKKMETLRFTFESQDSKVDLWLLPAYQFFPGKITIVNKKEDRTITLKLTEPPKPL